MLGVKEEVQGFFGSQRESENLTFEKKVEKVVFMGEPYEGHELSYVALYDTECLRGVLKMSDPRQGNKRPEKASTRKGLTLFSPQHQPYANKSCNKNN